MSIQEFIAELQEELEFDETLTADTIIQETEEWDSMGAMVLIGYIADNFDKTLTADDLKGITTINSLVKKIGVENFD